MVTILPTCILLILNVLLLQTVESLTDKLALKLCAANAVRCLRTAKKHPLSARPVRQLPASDLGKGCITDLTFNQLFAAASIHRFNQYSIRLIDRWIEIAIIRIILIMLIDLTQQATIS